MNEAKVRGVVHVIEDTKSFGARGFRKRLVVLEQNTGRFTNYIPVEFTNEGCDRVDELQVGDEVEVQYRLTGRRWQKDAGSEVKFFLSAEGLNFKVVKGKEGAAATDVAAEDPPFDSPGGDDEPPF